ncbi:hypothetical protein IMG5_186410 [Ichthyophthirius multifiliis]|uniref:Uncharacterized protein n=1 Tax=Ichthyophthirius multifiliis TaxID=5932 RepID=G0R3M4_ICHMU|nr:hypothetical protein IMG5_186410 [Ichthyophthirius multifiliis]EGR27931.1 hypothetical protein IMG5_186410 [Ichthyophthirius multifiliis]|eukprot:XP_004027276.1 hypothetical protein IMG5_186410 [Ichthyophthirius multifiliis]
MEVTIENFDQIMEEIQEIFKTKQFCRYSKYNISTIAISLLEETNENQIKLNSYLFYTFPSDETAKISINSVVYETDIDWNKWFCKGINYKNEDQLQKFRQKLFEEYDLNEQQQYQVLLNSCNNETNLKMQF